MDLLFTLYNQEARSLFVEEFQYKIFKNDSYAGFGAFPPAVPYLGLCKLRQATIPYTIHRGAKAPNDSPAAIIWGNCCGSGQIFVLSRVKISGDKDTAVTSRKSVDDAWHGVKWAQQCTVDLLASFLDRQKYADSSVFSRHIEPPFGECCVAVPSLSGMG
eukprot:scaffold1485_cov171-Amphora_coffeaeformis.AAC.20